MTNQVRYGSKEIAFEVTRRDRRTLAISVLPDQRVVVTAPFDASLDLIREKVLKRADWIIRQQIDFQSMEKTAPERRYAAGETHWYFGRQYRLKFVSSDSQRISLQNRYFMVEGTRDPIQVQTLLEAWYIERAKDRFSGLIGDLWPRLGGDAGDLPAIVVRKLEKRWGSCTARRLLILNWQLIKAPSSCIEYVLTHELCHLFEHNHGPRFIALMDRHMPDWRERKARLERMEG